jgi:hypothetical protein
MVDVDGGEPVAERLSVDEDSGSGCLGEQNAGKCCAGVGRAAAECDWGVRTVQAGCFGQEVTGTQQGREQPFTSPEELQVVQGQAWSALGSN